MRFDGALYSRGHPVSEFRPFEISPSGRKGNFVLRWLISALVWSSLGQLELSCAEEAVSQIEMEMRDGVTLKTTIWLPGDDAYPVVLARGYSGARIERGIGQMEQTRLLFCEPANPRQWWRGWQPLFRGRSRWIRLRRVDCSAAMVQWQGCHVGEVRTGE